MFTMKENLIEATKIVPNGKSKNDQFKKKFKKNNKIKVETKWLFFKKRGEKGWWGVPICPYNYSKQASFYYPKFWLNILRN